ncbi:PQQ-binding-like beta-propeller repeat protein [Actinoplanes sp. CA-030573]|uniref:outer membrane protein assembly factor BamB family protein n=1 Tax=Actinoplanes sp. CA-030573 TaxID=3239898 RepID=UPI003D8A2602
MDALRRTVAALLSFAVVFGPSPAWAGAPAGWDHAGYDAEDSYYNPHESAINAGTVGKLSLRWSVRLRDHDMSCGRFSAPLVAGGRVIATDKLGIAAYDALSGRPSWHFDWADPGDADVPRMATSGNTLIAATDDCNSASDPDGQMVALDLTTGRVRWRFKMGIPVYSFSVDKGVAVVSGYSMSDEKETVAYRASDGRVVWRKAGYTSGSASANGRILITDERVTSAVDITSGAVRWTRNAYWTAQAATPAADRFLVTDGARTLSAVSATTGAVLWTAPGTDNYRLATDGRRVYRATDSAVEALNAANGRRAWSRSMSSKAVQPLRAGGLLYAGGPILAAASGARLPQNLSNVQTITGGRLLTVTNNVLSSYTP